MAPERVSTRRQFDRLSHPTHRGRSGSFRIQYVESDEGTNEFGVAYSIHRSVGGAVTRNRIRRRIRSVFDELRSTIPSGLYLIKCDFHAKDLSYDRIASDIQTALRNAGLLG